jgi:hypothetical protein
MKKKYIILLFMLIAYNQAFAKQFVIKDVHVPDSIRIKEYCSYDMDEPISKDDILPTYNLLYPTKYSYGNGIYEYYRFGSPHRPCKIFICYNSKTYFFTHEGFAEPCDFIREYSECIAKLKINDYDAIHYLNAIWEFLREEIKKTYGYVRENKD